MSALVALSLTIMACMVYLAKWTSNKLARHAVINIIRRVLVRARISSAIEPTGLSRSDGKRLDGLPLVPWSAEKSIIWDVTVVDILAASYIKITSKQLAVPLKLLLPVKEINTLLSQLIMTNFDSSRDFKSSLYKNAHFPS